MIARSRISRVYAQKRQLLGTGNEDALYAVVNFENGAIGSIDYSWAWPDGLMNGYRAALEIVGTRVAAYLDVTDQGFHSVSENGTTGGDTPTAEGIAKTVAALATVPTPFDAVVLGMGNDGHTASFFPGGSNLLTALYPNTPRGIITMEAEGAGEPRLTFTFSSLQDARLLVLHIEGEGKKDVLAKAEASGEETEMPIRAMLRRAASPVEIYWAP